MVWNDALRLASLFIVLFTLHLIVGRLPCTGDEARYAYQGVGFYAGHRFVPEPEEWTRFASANGCPATGIVAPGQSGRPSQTISTSLAFGALLIVAGLEGARWTNFLVGCAALTLLYFLFKRLYPRPDGEQSVAAFFSLCAVALSIPFVAYLKLIYPEILLFAVATVALYGLLLRKHAAALTAAIVLPYLHLRALPLSATFVALQGRLRDWIAYAIGLICFAAVQFWLYGSVTGSAFPTYAPSPWIALQRVGMQLYDVRHGAITYAPLLLIGLAGLVAGAVRRDRACGASLLLFSATFATFMWSTASESWAGRFWVAALPFLAIGMCYWFSDAKWWHWLPAVPLASLTVLNTVFFTIYPLWYLESRQTSIPYAALFLMTHLNFGLFLPVDAQPGAAAAYAQPIAGLLLYTTLAIAILASFRAVGSTRLKAPLLLASMLLVTTPFALAIAGTVEPNEYVLATRPAQQTIAIRFKAAATRIDAIQFDDHIPAIWSAPPFPREFAVRCLRKGQTVTHAIVRARALLVLDGCSGIDAIELVGLPPAAEDGFYQHPGPIRLIRRAY